MTDTSERSSFEGFPHEAFSWFAGLESDNSRQYFKAHRGVYERAVRSALGRMLEELADELGGRVKLFRQQRDVRFSADKSPYKSRTYGVILERPDSLAPLYAQLSASGLFAGTGYYLLARDQLARFREAVADDASGVELERAVATIESAGGETFGEALKSAPRGYSRDHPRARFLRHRSLIAGRSLPPGPEGIDREAALEHTRDTWASCASLNAWLDANVGVSDLSPETR